MTNEISFNKPSMVFALVTLFTFALAPLTKAQTNEPLGTGFIEGRVFNAATGSALESARVTVEGSTFFAVTDGIGFFRIGPIPAGEKKLVVSYTGFLESSATVVVTKDQTVQKEFDLTVRREMPRPGHDEDVVMLEKYSVVADREISAQAIALNERREASNIKNVVAIDEYGYLGDENVGEFMRYLPGVAIAESGDTPDGVMLRGLPSASTNIQLDGFDIASANGSRSQSLLSIPMGNVSRIEVTKVPTPDMPASGLGGSVNLISSSGFIRRTPKFDYSVYITMLSSNIGIEGGNEGPVPSLSPKFQQPSVSLSYILPISRKFALTASVTRTWRNQPMDEARIDTQADWNFVTNFQRQSKWMALAHLYETWTAQIGATWRVSRSGMLTANIQRRHYEHELLRLDISLGYGSGATGDAHYSLGSTSANGTILQSGGPNRKGENNTTHSTLKYTHSWTRWKMDIAGSWSYNDSSNTDISNGYFSTAPTRIQNVQIRGDGIGENKGSLIPARYSAKKGGVPIDIYSGENYVIGQPTSDESKGTNNKYVARFDLSRDLAWDNASGAIKIGALYDFQDYETDPASNVWTFTPIGVANIASNFDVFNQSFNMSAPRFGEKQMDWINVRKLYQLYLQKPEWFVLDEAKTHQNNAGFSKKFQEGIMAGYIRADLRLLSNKLWIVTGARYERTEDKTEGMLYNPNAPYVRNPDGTPVRNPDGSRIFLPEANTALARTKMIYGIRGAHVERSYEGFYPSINISYTLTPNIIVRTAYARTIGRPDLKHIVPGTTTSTVADTESILVLNNPNLRPWTGNGYDLTVEFYGVKDGHGSIGIFQKNLSNFFEVFDEPYTLEIAEKYGIPYNSEYEEQNWSVRSRRNGTNAKILGYEFSWTQKLTFLPYWARGIRVFFNATKLDLNGSATADFAGYAPENFSAGIDLVRSRYSVKVGVTYQAETRGSQLAESAANGVPKDVTYNYRGEALKIRLNAEYSISKRLAFYLSIADLQPDGNIALSRRYTPDSPEYVKDYRRQDLGRSITIGVRGSF